MCKTPQNTCWILKQILFIALTSQGKKTTKQEISWYFILVSAIAGFVVGVFLVYGMQCLCRKKRNEKEKENEDEPEAAANPSYDGQVDPTSSAEAV